MKKNLKQEKLLYLIAEFKWGEDKILEALRAGVDVLQLREKHVSSAEFLERARRMRSLTRAFGTLFLVNDRADIAYLSEADGVHLGQSDIPVADARKLLGEQAIIGATAKTALQAVQAEAAGADYLGSGAWFATATKEDAVLITDETYREILASTKIPNVAVGGITPENCGRPLLHKASGLAVSAGILGASSISDAVLEFRKLEFPQTVIQK